MRNSSSIFVAAIALAQAGAAVQLNAKDINSIKTAASEVAKTLYTYHNEEATTGQFNQPQPWFWWLSGSGWTGLMEYTVFTKDTSYKAGLLSALAKNVGPNFDFVPPEQAGWEANDDQAYWVYNSLSAMEYGFDTLPGAPSWDVISTNAFNLFVSRWNADSGTCGGGLKWQYNRDHSGWTYKNSVTNGGFFQTAARLARYTGDQKFADWATKIWDWSTRVGLVTSDYHVFDGTSDENQENCTKVNQDEWSYNIATYLHGAAHMYNLTGDPIWEERVLGFVKTASTTFFKSGVMFEQKCEPSRGCTTDQTSFKASLSRWLGKTAVLVPSAKAQIMTLLEKSADGAAQSCVGNGGSTCGVSWLGTGFDGQSDFGTQLSALEAIQSLLVFEAPPFVVADGVPKTGNDDETPPKEDDDATPPKEDDEATPPKEDDEEVPPVEDDKTPPAEEDNTTPPAEDDKTPPTEDVETPPPEETKPPPPPKCGSKKRSRKTRKRSAKRRH